tara:strand:+ start:690 stop:1247 length:558 start_codon:yes stop_codon:yes gene_type:complete
MISREEKRNTTLKQIEKSLKKRDGSLTIYDVKTTNYSSLKTWQEKFYYSDLQLKIELLYEESLKNKGYSEKQILIEMNKIDKSKISINEDDTFNLVFYPEEELRKSRENFIDHVVWDQMMLHNSPKNKIKNVLSHFYPDITDKEVKLAIKKYEKKYNKEQDLKKSKTECVYDNLNRLPGSGWSKQ